ncbi:hypothetical protein [Flavivirga aquatica]|nr:hypothetical protein [Flavivirga aquatica]
MKTILKYFCLLFIVGSIFSCQDDDKEQFQLFKGNDAPFVNIILNKTLIGKTAALDEEVMVGVIDAPGKNVDSYTLSVRVTGSTTTNSVDLTTITTFPTTVTYSTIELASALGISLNDLEPADEFEFSGVSTGRGFTLTSNNLAPDLFGQPEQNQAYDFSLTLFCSPAQGNVTGDWTLDLTDTFGDGWDGAFITATIDGVDTNYTISGGASEQHIVNVASGSSVIWTYTQGSFEEEHIWSMTGPDGTVYGPFDGNNDIPFCFF